MKAADILKQLSYKYGKIMRVHDSGRFRMHSMNYIRSGLYDLFSKGWWTSIKHMEEKVCLTNRQIMEWVSIFPDLFNLSHICSLWLMQNQENARQGWIVLSGAVILSGCFLWRFSEKRMLTFYLVWNTFGTRYAGFACSWISEGRFSSFFTVISRNMKACAGKIPVEKLRSWLHGSMTWDV